MRLIFRYGPKRKIKPKIFEYSFEGEESKEESKELQIESKEMIRKFTSIKRKEGIIIMEGRNDVKWCSN